MDRASGEAFAGGRTLRQVRVATSAATAPAKPVPPQVTRLPDGFALNEGRRPGMCAGKRVTVILFGNRYTGKQSGPWPADGREGCNWNFRKHRFDIWAWKIA